MLPIPAENVEKYKQIAQKAGELWKEHGALHYWEGVGDDLEHEHTVNFNRSAGVGTGEIVVLAWIVFESKAERDRINALVMADPRMNEMMDADDAKVFDYKRMAYGGFKTLVNI